jgi:hypothetical protein
VGEGAQPGALTTGSAVEPGIVHKLALAEQRNAGWDSKWPFIPADMLNADFRHLIATDPELTAVEKEQIFQAGKNLGVVSKSESVQQAAADKAAPAKAEPKRPIKGFGAGKAKAADKAAADKAKQQAATDKAKAAADKAKQQAAADKAKQQAAADKAKQQAAADKTAADKVQREINKIALNDKKAKAAADEAEQQQNLRSEAKSILSAAGYKQAEITDLLAAYDSFTPKDIDNLRKDFPRKEPKPKSKISPKEVDKIPREEEEEEENEPSASKGRRLYSMADMRKLPKTSDKGFAESVNALRREDESPYIVQETKTSDDINKIAEEVLKDVAANPERYAVQVNSLTADQYFRDETTGEKVDITNPNEHYRLSDLGRQLAKTDPATLKTTLQQEAEQTTKQRQDALRDLSNYLIGNLWLDGDGNYTPYTPTEAGRIVLLASKLSYVETKEGVQIVQLANNNRHVMTVSGELASRINEKLNGGLSIKEALKKAVEENTAAQKRSSDEQGWKKYKQSEAYEDAAVLSQEVCGTGWCTGTTSTAQSQLSKGDFWVYFDNGKPEIALRTEDGSLTAADPPRGTLPGQRLSPEYQEIADKFLRTTDEVKGGEAYLKARDTMEAYRTYKKTNDIAPLRKYLTYTVEGGAFSEAVFVEPEELSGYGEPAEYSVADPEYVGKPTPKRVPFSVNLLDPTTILEHVGGELVARKLTSAPMLKTVGGYFNSSSLTSAPMLETVGRNLIANSLTSAPMLRETGGSLFANSLTSAPMLKTVGRNLEADSLTSAPRLETVGESVSARQPN